MKILFLTGDYLTRPLGIASLAASAAAYGHQCEVAALRDVQRQKKLLQGFRPRVLCLSLVTGQHILFIKRVREIKKSFPDITVLAGGPHPTFYPESVHEPNFDAVCRGEGDLAFPFLINAFEREGCLPLQAPNWLIKMPDGSVSKNNLAPLVENLDTLPYPDRGMFDRAQPGYRPVTAYVMTSRGCPYNCSYCFNHAYRELYRGLGRMCRRRSIANLLGELVFLKRRYPLQIIVFQDDTFNLDKQWLREFADVYQREIHLPFHCHLRADIFDEECAELLCRAGCLSVKLGLESGREHVRNEILNRNMSLEQFESACRLLRRFNIRFATENILAVPGTRLDDDLFTYSVNCRVRPQHSFATLMQLYPRTMIAEYALEHGHIEALPASFPDTFYNDGTVAIDQKSEKGRLRALFALGVSMNIPVAFMQLLIRMPLRRFYECVDRFWKGYCLRFRIYPYRQNIPSFFREVLQYLRGKYY